DLRPDVQRDQLDAAPHGPHDGELLVARQCQPRHGLDHHRQHVAGPALLRHHAPGRAPDDLPPPPPGGGHRRGERDPALLAHHDAGDQAGADHRHDVLRDLHVLGLPAPLHPHPRRAGQRDPPVRHLCVRHRHVGGAAGDGGRRGPGEGAGAGAPDRRPGACPRGEIVVGEKTGGAGVLGLSLPLGFFLIAMLFPFYWMAITSIKPNRELYSQKIMPLIVHQPTLTHYIELFDGTNFLTWTYNTMLVAVVTTVISFVIGVLLGYPLATIT